MAWLLHGARAGGFLDRAQKGRVPSLRFRFLIWRGRRRREPGQPVAPREARPTPRDGRLARSRRRAGGVRAEGRRPKPRRVEARRAHGVGGGRASESRIPGVRTLLRRRRGGCKMTEKSTPARGRPAIGACAICDSPARSHKTLLDDERDATRGARARHERGVATDRHHHEPFAGCTRSRARRRVTTFSTPTSHDAATAESRFGRAASSRHPNGAGFAT